MELILVKYHITGYNMILSPVIKVKQAAKSTPRKGFLKLFNHDPQGSFLALFLPCISPHERLILQAVLITNSCTEWSSSAREIPLQCLQVLTLIFSLSGFINDDLILQIQRARPAPNLPCTLQECVLPSTNCLSHLDTILDSGGILKILEPSLPPVFFVPYNLIP